MRFATRWMCRLSVSLCVQAIHWCSPRCILFANDRTMFSKSPGRSFVSSCGADLEAQVLILTPLVVAVDYLEFEAYLARIGAAQQIGCYNSAEFAFA